MLKRSEVVLYGVKVVSDIAWPLDFPTESAYRTTVSFFEDDGSSYLRMNERHFLYTSHGRKIYISSDGSIDGPFVSGQRFCYEVEDVVRFFWSKGSDRLNYQLLCDDLKKTTFWFAHTFLPLYISFEKIALLFHASSVLIDNVAVAFIAPSMGGKSTLCDFFVRQGHRLVTDDLLPLYLDDDGKVVTTGSYPYNRPYRAYETLGDRCENFQTEFSPLRSVMLLEKSRDDTIRWEKIEGIEKFVAAKRTALVYNIDAMRREYDDRLASIVNRIEMYRFVRPWDIDSLQRHYKYLTNIIK